jgi:glycosyltransferase involved in cell wall biosynthesis
MRILLINSLYPPLHSGGAGLSVKYLAEGLSDSGMTIGTLSTSPECGVTGHIRNGVRCFYVGIANFYWPFDNKERPLIAKGLWHSLDVHNPYIKERAKKIIHHFEPDLIHTNNITGFGKSIFRISSEMEIPLVHTLRDYQLLCIKGTLFDKGNVCQSRCLKCKVVSNIKANCLNNIDHVVGNSKYILDKHTQHGIFANAKSSVIFNAYRKPESYPNFDVSFSSKKLFRIGYLGRLSKMKGLEMLLDQFCQFEIDNYQLHIGGKGSENYEKHMRDKYENENIHFHGFVDPHSFLDFIDVLVVPSIWPEPLPRTIYEAFAHETPVIAAKSGGIPEIVDHGQNGFLFSKDRPEKIIKYIKKIKENGNINSEIKERALAYSKHFKPSNVASRYSRVYKKVDK